MSEPSQLGEAVIGLLRPTTGLSLLGEYQGSGFTEPRFLVRRGDGQVIQLSRLLYLVAGAITDAAVGGDGAAGANVVAARVSPEFGREVTAANVRYLVATKLAPLGVVIAAAPVETGAAVPVQAGVPAPAAAPGLPAEAAPPAPRVNLLLGLKVRGVLLPARAANAVGRALAWLHFPPLVVLVLAGFAAFEGWLFGVHGAIGPLLGILDDPVLFFAVAGLTLVSLLFHEFGHASACRYGGARPGVIGFGLYLIWPSLYTDVTDAYRLSRAGRLRTDLGGVYFNAIFVVILGACYAATGQPLFLAAAFLDNFQILQQLFPLVRMDGYFILGDVAGIPDLLGLLGPIMASVLPGRRARRAGARAPTLRRGPRLLVTAWVLVAIPLLAAALGYTLWNLPVLVRTASRSFSSGATAARADFSAGHPAAGLAAGLNVVLLLIPAAGLAYLLARIVARGGDTGQPAAGAHGRPGSPGGPGWRGWRDAGGSGGDQIRAGPRFGRSQPGPGRGLGRAAGEPGHRGVLRPGHVRAAPAGRFPRHPADDAGPGQPEPARFRGGDRHEGGARRVRRQPDRGLRAAGAGGLRLGRQPGRGPGHRPRRRGGPGGRRQRPASLGQVRRAAAAAEPDRPGHPGRAA
jgi:putative peptide zinc metalloprotease protein